MRQKPKLLSKEFDIIVNQSKRKYSYCDPQKEPPEGWKREHVSQRDITLADYIYDPWPYSTGTNFGAQR